MSADGSSGQGHGSAARRTPEEEALREVYAGWVARERADGVADAAGRWRADAILREEFDFGAAIAAARLRLPCAELQITATGTFLRGELVFRDGECVAAPSGRLIGDQ